jgi:Xaa-Pro aminopeptidase
MNRRKVDAILVLKREDINYLADFTGEDSALVVASGSASLITDSRFDEQADRECPWLSRKLRKKSLNDAVSSEVRRRRIDRLGVDEGDITLSVYSALRKSLGTGAVRKIGSIAGRLRERKDEHEIAILDEAIDIAERAFRAMRKSLRAGQSERQAAARLEYEMQKLGASGSSFPIIAAVGANGSLPHAQPGQDVLTSSEAILFDWGAIFRSYCSDLTRVLVPRKIRSDLRRIYEVCLEAQIKGIESIKPGVKFSEADRVARNYIKKAGFGEHFGHGLGHGIGLEIHEAPTLSPRGKGVLVAGMVVTVEPGIYIPGVGGVRIEDDVLVTEDGHRVLTTLPKDLDEMRLAI